MSVYTVWVQPIDEYTTPENVDKYGSVHDVVAEYENDDGGTPNKQFCDGQTSKTPPRYATDNMIGIYTRSDEAAQIIGETLRDDVRSRIASGLLQIPLPTWYVPQVNALGFIIASDLALLKRRLYLEFPTASKKVIDDELLAIMESGIDNLSTLRIIEQVRRHLLT